MCACRINSTKYAKKRLYIIRENHYYNFMTSHLRKGEEIYLIENRLTLSELVVMRAIWSYGKPVTLSRIEFILHKEFDKDWKQQTVYTFIRRLKYKGFISRYKEDNMYRYVAEITNEQYRVSMVLELIDNFYIDLDDLMRELKKIKEKEI